MKSNPKNQQQKSLPLSLPLFITFEGGEGAGKTTLINRLKEHLEDAGYSVIVTREPGGSRLGEQIRDLLLHRLGDIPIGDKAELLLFLAARAQHVEEVIRPSLREDKIILCDRFNDSSVAYQGYARGLGMDNVIALSAFATEGVAPHLTLFLDIDPQLGLERASKTVKDNQLAGKPDRIEAQKQEFHALVRTAFLSIAQQDPKRVKVINAHDSPDKVFKQALQLIQTFEK